MGAPITLPGGAPAHRLQEMGDGEAARLFTLGLVDGAVARPVVLALRTAHAVFVAGAPPAS